jgi:cephalosporin hydroxylase
MALTYAQIFYESEHNAINKWAHYLWIYDEIFAPLRPRQNLTILEIGIQNGGSLQALSMYFDPTTKIHGLDIDPRCAGLAVPPNVTIHIGNAADHNVLKDLPECDLIIDDGSHRSADQLNSILFLYDRKLKEDGIYLVEDLEHNYMHHEPVIFVDVTKTWIDHLNTWNMRGTYKLTYYPQMLCVHKKAMGPPENIFSPGPRPVW